MKIIIDTEEKTLQTEDNGQQKTIDLYSKEGFETLCREWVRVGWNEKYQYSFSWMGRPVIQLPEDMIRTQEVIYQVKPDIIIETGIAHGGSLIYYASLCKAMEKGRIVGIDIEIREHNRKAIEAHELFPLITMYEGSSTAPDIVEQVKAEVKPGDTVLILLDSNHTYAHVLEELKCYADLVSIGSYIVATDGIMYDLHDVPRGDSSWATDHPARAAQDFVRDNPNFVIEQPAWPFNESELEHNITHWPGAWIKRVS